RAGLARGLARRRHDAAIPVPRGGAAGQLARGLQHGAPQLLEWVVAQRCDTSCVNEQDSGAERHINIHLSPEIMGGVYANFANVSHSDYEFTVTFAGVDHEVESEEFPGVVVSSVSLSPRSLRGLLETME